MEGKLNLKSIIQKYNIIDIDKQLLVSVNMYTYETHTSSNDIQNYFSGFENSFPDRENRSDWRKHRGDETYNYAYINNIELDYDDALYLYKYYIAKSIEKDNQSD